MSDDPKISPEAAEGLRMVYKAHREGKLPDSPYPVVFPHIARPPKDDTLQYSQQDDPGSFDDASLAGYKIQTGNGPYIGYDMSSGADKTCVVLLRPARMLRRKTWLIVAACFILAGLGFTALYLLAGG